MNTSNEDLSTVFQNFPKALQPLYGSTDLRSDVLLTKARMHISFRDRDIELDGELYLTVNPSPSIEYRSVQQEYDILLFAAFIKDEVNISIEAFPEAKWMLTGTNPIRAEANPSHISHSKDEKVQVITFHLINFEGFIGSPVLHNDGRSQRGRIILEVDKWKITIDSLKETSNTIQVLNTIGGYAITHVGKIEQINGKGFKASKGNKVINELAYFLSFTRGAWVPIPLREGCNSKGEAVWFEWGVSPNYSSWKSVYSWFEGVHVTESLPSAFSGYFKLMEDPYWKSVLPKIVYWYILSNTLRNIDGSIVLAQTVLELLAWNYLVVQTGVLSQDTFSKINASEQFKLLLAMLNIPLDIPVGLVEVLKVAKSHNLDGLGVVTSARNSLVHPGKKAKAIPTTNHLLFETWNLALWYIELVLLRLCSYNGPYISRVLGRTAWPDDVEPVPWAVSQTEESPDPETINSQVKSIDT